MISRNRLSSLFLDEGIFFFSLHINFLLQSEFINVIADFVSSLVCM